MVFLQLKKFIDAAVTGKVICGLDEVGRGPWAGPLVACALVLKKDLRFKGLKDSKKMTGPAREKIFKMLGKRADWGIGVASVAEIDKLGLIKATNLAFNRALSEMAGKKGSVRPDFLVVDGRDRLELPIPHKTVIKGDEKIKIIACASIVAKVVRDRMMREMGLKWPGYGFEKHKGYGTALHLEALKKHGPCELHRRSFRPVKEIL